MAQGSDHAPRSAHIINCKTSLAEFRGSDTETPTPTPTPTPTRSCFFLIIFVVTVEKNNLPCLAFPNTCLREYCGILHVKCFKKYLKLGIKQEFQISDSLKHLTMAKRDKTLVAPRILTFMYLAESFTVSHINTDFFIQSNTRRHDSRAILQETFFKI